MKQRFSSPARLHCCPKVQVGLRRSEEGEEKANALGASPPGTANSEVGLRLKITSEVHISSCFRTTWAGGEGGAGGKEKTETKRLLI